MPFKGISYSTPWEQSNSQSMFGVVVTAVIQREVLDTLPGHGLCLDY